eukprot:TRINITY_DN1931_c0_g2_i1.p1 TRINITY_DN1931_c0_g2~~TRINITY_DN1931_c0_g2_i1.p1  ORF type:complete len:350 (-),score=77.12 TRINITY_DN1931_c0_g2_i1:146-1144(-)
MATLSLMLTLSLFLSLTLSFLPQTHAVSGTYKISYHEYPTSDKTSSSCYYYDYASKWANYVTATVISDIACGQCVKMTSTDKYGSKTIYVVRIDIGGQGFDLNKPAFDEMCGNQGYLDGHCDISYETVDASLCNSWIASHGGTGVAVNPGGTVPPPPPTSGTVTPPPTTGGTVRCGSSWSDANSNCRKACTTGSDCSGIGGCYKDLAKCTVSPPPTTGTVPPPPPPTTTGSTGCPTGTRCYSTNPGQNPSVDWASYCNQKQGGMTFCQLKVSGCGCVSQLSGAQEETSSTSSSEVDVGMWAGIGVGIGLLVLVVVVGVLVYVKRSGQIIDTV